LQQSKELLSFKIRTTPEFDKWLESLRDRVAQKQVIFRLRRFERANFGDVKPVGQGVYEARIAYGPGYRLYYIQSGKELVFMLCGGDKGSQKRDIIKAKEMAKEV